MNLSRSPIVLTLLSALLACGGQVVEFELTDGDVARADAGSLPDAEGNEDAPAGEAPTVVFNTPVNGAGSVPLATMASATFSKTMDESTLDDTTFTLAQGATSVPGKVSFDGTSRTATFDPDASLTTGLVYTATVTTGAQDPDGLALATDHTWSFTAAADADAPVVVAFTPTDLAANVSVQVRPSATFSKAMDPATITSLTFIVKQGLSSVPGTVRLDGVSHTATFTPDQALGIGLPYRATITIGARDTGGLALATETSWTFVTSACSLATVNLRSASNFVVLAGSTVTNTGPTSITGDLGVSPGTAVTGFGPGIIIGSKHAGNPTAATGIADLTTAYNDAKGRTLCPVVAAGNLGGLTLAPGLYKSTSSLEITSGDLTLDAQGDGDAVFVFQMASTLTTTAGRQVILTNGARSANVFWQVGTSATLGTTSAFQGTIMADQAISLGTGATLNGRALARIAAVSLDTNTIVKPAP